MSHVITNFPAHLIAAGYVVDGGPREFGFQGERAMGQAYSKRGNRPADIARAIKRLSPSRDWTSEDATPCVVATYKNHGDDVVMVRLM
jgi:hypothetical protein